MVCTLIFPAESGRDFFCTLITEYRSNVISLSLAFGNPVRYRYGLIPTVIRTNTAKPLEIISEKGSK